MRKTSIPTVQDPQFQKELVSIMLSDSLFASKFHQLIYTDNDLKKEDTVIFSVPSLERLVREFFRLYESNESIPPTPGVLRNHFERMKITPAEVAGLKKQLAEVLKIEVENSEPHKKELVNLLTVVKSAVAYKKLSAMIRTGNYDKILDMPATMAALVEELQKIKFDESDVIEMDNWVKIVTDYADDSNSNIPTGIEELDRELNGGGKHGGIARQGITLFISQVNDAKSIGVLSIEANAVRAGYRVLHFNLEGKRLQPPMRIISNLSEIPMRRLQKFREYIKDGNLAVLKNYLSPEEYARLVEGAKKHGENMKIVHDIKDTSVETICARAREIYKVWPFDMITIDYGQLMTSVKTFSRPDLELGHIFREVESLVSELNAAGLIPMQVKAEAAKKLNEEAENGVKYPVFGKYSVGDSKKTIDTADCAITWNRTNEERAQRKGRYCILKQREGITGLQVGVQPEWSTMNLTKGERYYYGMGEEESSSLEDTFGKFESAFKEGGFSEAVKENVSRDLAEMVESSNFLKNAAAISDLGGLEHFKSRLELARSLQEKMAKAQRGLEGADPESEAKIYDEIEDLRSQKEGIWEDEKFLEIYQNHFEDTEKLLLQKARHEEAREKLAREYPAVGVFLECLDVIEKNDLDLFKTQ